MPTTTRMTCSSCRRRARKEWRVHAPGRAAPEARGRVDAPPRRGRAAATRAPVLVRTLEPGDVVYLPRGWIHAARANAGLSLHLTFGIHPYTRRHLVDALVARALDPSPAGGDPLDASLPLGLDLADPSALDAILASVGALSSTGSGSVGISAVSAALERRWAADTRPLPVRPVVQLLAADALGRRAIPRTTSAPGPTGLVDPGGGRRRCGGAVRRWASPRLRRRETPTALRRIAAGLHLPRRDLVGSTRARAGSWFDPPPRRCGGRRGPAG